MTAILISGVTSKRKIMFQPGGFTDFTMIDESKLDEMIDFSSEIEVCTWAKYQRIDYCTIKQVSGFQFPFTAGFQAAKSVRVVSSRSYSETSISRSMDNFKTFIG